MKKLLIVFVTFYSFALFSQHSDRVLEIKKMYKQTKSFDDKKNCETLRWEEIDENDGYERPLKRKVAECIYPESYARISLSFEFLESWLDAEYYFKNDNLYFAYIVDDFGSDKYKIRIYFKADLEVEKVLFDNGQGNTKINDKNTVEDIKKQYLKWLYIAEDELN